MEKENYDGIWEKTENASSYSECRKVLADEELAILGIHHAKFPDELGEGDECLVKDILLLLKASRCSTRHSLFVLDRAKDALLMLSFPMP